MKYSGHFSFKARTCVFLAVLIPAFASLDAQRLNRHSENAEPVYMASNTREHFFTENSGKHIHYSGTENNTGLNRNTELSCYPFSELNSNTVPAEPVKKNTAGSKINKPGKLLLATDFLFYALIKITRCTFF